MKAGDIVLLEDLRFDDSPAHPKLRPGIVQFVFERRDDSQVDGLMCTVDVSPTPWAPVVAFDREGFSEGKRFRLLGAAEWEHNDVVVVP